MRSDADMDLIRRDAALSGLGILLDEARFLGLLRRANPGLEIASGRLEYLRYKPGTNCLASYLVEAGGRGVPVHGKAWSGDAGVKLGKRQERPGVGRVGSLAGGFDAAMGVAVEVFPTDAKLGGLGAWVDAGERCRFLAGRPGLESLAGAPVLEVLHYKPERRWVGKLVGADGRPAAVIKVHTEEGFAPAYAASRVIRDGRGYGVPRVLGRSRRRSAMVLRWEDGEEFGGGAGVGEGGWGRCGELGAALAGFHGQGVLGLGTTAWDGVASRVAEEARTVGWLVPGLAGRAARLAEVLAAAIIEAPATLTTVHGDFHPGQVLRVPGGLVLLDLDAAGTAPGWVDVARFLAHLEVDVVRGRCQAAAVARVRGELLDGYEASTRDRLPAGLPALVAAELVGFAVQLFRNRERDWAGAMAMALERAEALPEEGWGLGRGQAVVRGGRSMEPGAGVGSGIDGAMPFLGRALDVAWMDSRLRGVSPRLATALAGHRLGAADVVRHKPGRRCLIEYRFRSVDGAGGLVWLGKARARRGRGWALQAGRALREAGFGDGSDVSVPEPLGEVPELHLELQPRVGGEVVSRRLEEADVNGWMRRCAEVVGRVHRSGVVLARVHSLADEMTILRDRLREVEGVRPGLAARIGAVREACEQLAGTLSEPEPRLIHRDFHPEQVLVDGGRLWLLDLDLCAMGDPMVDHGNFLAHLMEWSLRRHGQVDGLRGVIGAYREAVLSGGMTGRDGERRLEGLVTLSLARHLQICTRFPDREAWLPPLLEVCEQRLSGVSRAVCV